MKKLFFLLAVLLTLTSYSQSQVTFRYTQKKVFDELIHQYGEAENETGYFEFHFDKDDMLKNIHFHSNNNTRCYDITVFKTHYDILGELSYGKFRGTSITNKNTIISILIDSGDSYGRNVVFWDETLNRDVIYNCSVVELSSTEYQEMNTEWWINLTPEELRNLRK